MYCQNCGKPVAQEARYCRYCGVELKETPLKPVKKKNQYDESVKSFFTSKTFRILLTIGLIGGCCYATVGFSLVSTFAKFATNLISLPAQIMDSEKIQPYIVSSTQDDVDPRTEAALNEWLRTSAPADVPYWFVTHWQQEDDGRILVSLAGVNVASPDEEWSLTHGDKVIWIGSVEVIGDGVKLSP